MRASAQSSLGTARIGRPAEQAGSLQVTLTGETRRGLLGHGLPMRLHAGLQTSTRKPSSSDWAAPDARQKASEVHTS